MKHKKHTLSKLSIPLDFDYAVKALLSVKPESKDKSEDQPQEKPIGKKRRKKPIDK